MQPEQDTLGALSIAGDGPGARMQRFAARLLAQGGALAEVIEPDGLEVIAPDTLQQALGIGELCRLGFGPTMPVGAERVAIESDWLGRFDRVLSERGRFARRIVPAAGRRAPDAAALLAQELVLDNATFRLLDVAPAWTRILILEFRYSAMSDEKREGTQRLAINLATGAMPDATIERLAPLLWAEGNRPESDADAATPQALPEHWAPQRIAEQVSRAMPWRMEQALTPFVKGLERRLARDQERLHAYHDDLHREALLRAAGLSDSDAAGRARQTARIAAIGREYEAKLDDLARKYALSVSVDWVQTLEVIAPVQRLTVQIRRRKAERTVLLDWNAAARSLEPPLCEATCSAARPRLVCDDALHLVSTEGLAPCEACARAFCRACHRQKCPKCGHPTRLSPSPQSSCGPINSDRSHGA